MDVLGRRVRAVVQPLVDELPRGTPSPAPPRPKEREATLAAAEVASDWETAARHLPLAELPAFKKVAPYWREWLEHPSYDAFWKRVDQAKAGPQGPVAPGGRLVRQLRADTSTSWPRCQSIRGRAKGRSRLVIGPWDHEAYLSVRPTASGSREFRAGRRRRGDADERPRPRVVRPVAQGRGTRAASDSAPVRYFVMGENRWAGALTWPPKHKPTWYLRSAGAANSRLGDGALSPGEPGRTRPTASSTTRRTPCRPSAGARSPRSSGRAGSRTSRTWSFATTCSSTPRRCSPRRCRSRVRSRRCCTSSSAVDTDVTAKLVDVEPDRFCANVAEGIIRARYREGFNREVLLAQGPRS